MNEKRKTELRTRFEKLIWTQVDLFEKINLRLETGELLLNELDRLALREVAAEIGQLELEVDVFMGSCNKAIEGRIWGQPMFEEIEIIPISEAEIPF